ncbi:MAG: valine--tRNA ligase [Tepidisphaera sp.]|nr:valine--tRNA ligase [Tepidisphaera sp.]
MSQHEAAGVDSSANELPKQYRPSEHEPRIWKAWTDAKAFHADPGRVLRGEAAPYCVLIPPPNVTAALHLGHALNNTLQDILVRAHRMMGFETLWMPGTDHAGIATQAVVEKRVLKEEKKRRTDFTREAFVEKIQAFKDEYEAVITNQLKAMGCSCDWDRQRFTMDEVCASAVREAFFRLFKDGLIYRGKRLVNWDPVLQTAVADDECYDEEIDGAFHYLRYPLVHPAAAGADPQPVTWDELVARGYPDASQHPADQPAWVTVATTRPETYLGDTAVALNPHDPRAKALRGLSVELPLVGRVIPIIEDAYVVLPERYARTEEEKNDPKAAMATGFLKVTPAHDFNDEKLGLAHRAEIEAANLPIYINMMAKDGTVSDKHGWNDVGDAHIFVGKKREEARKLVKQEFDARGLYEGNKPHRHSVKHSDRSKAIIEPYLSDQWYVKVTDPSMAKAANEALKEKKRPLEFFPSRYTKTYEQWHENIRDWCISRQLWWGHRIPVWSQFRDPLVHTPTGHLDQDGEPDFNTSLSERDSGILNGVEELMKEYPGQIWMAVKNSGFRPENFNLQDDSDLDERFDVVCAVDDPSVAGRLSQLGFTQDPDVLDTWFSSALWPLSTMGWPNPEAAAAITRDASMKDLLAAFNPTTTLCTAREIITLWVSRMVMFNRYFLPEGWPGSAASPQSQVPSASASGRGHGPAPFRDVFIHAVIQDGEGRKMSKSLGNGVDPLDIIATHGTDAMRFTLCQMATNTQDVRLPVIKDSATGKNTSPKFDLGRNFATKLWNAAKFAMTILSANPAPQETPSRESLSLADKWMLSRLHAAISTCDKALKDYEFSVYAQTMYSLLWNDFCDWYLEAIKPSVASNPGTRAVLRGTLDAILRLLHPVMPFVTETIFDALAKFSGAAPAGLSLTPPRRSGLLCLAGWPIADAALHDPHAEGEFEKMRMLVSAIREVRAQHNVPFKRKITLHPPSGMSVVPSADLTSTLAGLEAISHAGPAGPSVTFVADTHEYRLSNLADEVDTGAEKARLTKLVADLDKSIATLEGRLNNPGYAQKAPPHMVQQSKDQLAKAQTERATAAAALAALP